MTIRTYLARSHARYRYVGTVWGDTPCAMTGKEFAKMLKNADDGKGEVSVYADEDGYYITPRSITYRNGSLIQETVLELLA